MRYSIFGESHGPAIGVVLEGVPPGLTLDMDGISKEMARRAPGNSPLSTARKEADQPEILSGVFEGRTTGTPSVPSSITATTIPEIMQRPVFWRGPATEITPALSATRVGTTIGAAVISPAD